MTDPSGSATYSYQRRGLLAAEQKTIGTATYTSTYGYDADGNRSTIGYPSGRTVTYTFDFADRPYSASSGSTARRTPERRGVTRARNLPAEPTVAAPRERHDDSPRATVWSTRRLPASVAGAVPVMVTPRPNCT